MKDFFSSTGFVGSTSSRIGISVDKSVTVDKAELDRLIHKIEEQRKTIIELEKKLQTNKNDFTEQEIKFILMRCHPDKNPNSKQSLELTRKILKMRNKV
jgi:hypothetical protein